jgi:DNA mismatch repair protein MutS
MGEKDEKLSPMRRQYLALKRQYPDAILFFRLGDFYETFERDAELTARLLQITLTSREMGKGVKVPLAGVPYHAAEGYIARLIAAGQKVAVCEQLDAAGVPMTGIGKPPPGHGMPLDHPTKSGSKPMMTREVIRVVTPGTVVEPRMLEAQRNNYLCALIVAYEPNGLPMYGLAYADLSTGEFATTELHGEDAPAELSRELERLQPVECVVPDSGPPGLNTSRDPGAPTAEAAAAQGRTLARVDRWRFELETAQETLCRLFGVSSLAGYGCAHLSLAVRAAGALVAYVEQTHRQLLALLDGLRTYAPGDFVRLDGFTRRNLEIHEDRTPDRLTDGPRPTLFSVLDDTRTPMGGRLLRRWLGQPLRDLAALGRRHDAVEDLAHDGVLRGQLRTVLSRISDLERLTNRVRQGSALPRDLLALRHTLLAAAELRSLVEGTVPTTSYSGAHAGAQSAGEATSLRTLLEGVDGCPEVASLVERAVYNGAPDPLGGKAIGSWDEERLIKPGYSDELDEMVRSSADARAWIAGLEAVERERTGIKGLRVGFNKVFGYYLHVSHAYKGEVPSHYVRRQTLADGERYITPELKEYENVVLSSAERIAALERTLFSQLQREIATHADPLLATAAALAQLDTLASFAEVAVRRGYVRPTLDEGETIEIEEGRHPVVEYALEMATAQLGQPASFVPNDCALSSTGQQIIILTGPNMAGKSTFLRSVALIVLMAQAGSFVPARSAHIGLVDRIFTRVGAHDDLAAGQSTFMVEMVETASILRHATPQSLVILDEIGRGTSTYDGVAIAQAVVEYLHQGKTGPRTLFATHYHELAELEATLPRIRNHRVDVLEEGDRVVFLHRVVAGSADRSYGIHVARLAGVPRPVTLRAQEILEALETRHALSAPSAPTSGPAPTTNGHTARRIDPKKLGQSRLAPAASPATLDTLESVPAFQLSLFAPDHPIVEELKIVDVLGLTPLQALNLLAALAERARG